MLKTFLFRSGLKQDSSWCNFIIQWMTLGLLLHIVGAIKSSGFYHNDEHFQIVEFVNAKLGRSSLAELPLEFREFMRPWLFPAICTGITLGLKSIGITNPFDWAMGYRIFSALMGWISTVGVGLCCFIWFPHKKWRNYAVITMTLLWYMPALHARHSSENLSGSTFMIALTLLLLGTPAKKDNTEQPDQIPFLTGLLSGIFLGLAFEFRYQVGIMIVGMLLWLLIIARMPLFRIVPILFGILLSIILGIFIDFWGYENWEFAPWNYLNHNIIQHHLNDGDTSPWWDYFRRSLTESWPFLGFLTLISFLLAWLRNPKHILTWSFLPFFLAHLWISHKEFRFLFPLAHAGGVLLILAISSTNPVSRSIRWIFKTLIGFNLIALLILTTIPAWMPISFYEQLYQFKKQTFRIYTTEDSLFNLGGAIMNFYRPPNMEIVQLKNYSDFILILQKNKNTLWFYYPYFNLPEEAGVLKKVCSAEFSALPSWIERYKIIFIPRRFTNWTLYRCSVIYEK